MPAMSKNPVSFQSPSPLHSSHSAGKISPDATDESPPARTQPANQPATLLAATLVAGQKQAATLPFPSVAGLPDVITGKLLAKNLLPSNKTSNILSPPPIRRRCLRYFPATFCHKALKCMTDSMNPSQRSPRRMLKSYSVVNWYGNDNNYRSSSSTRRVTSLRKNAISDAILYYKRSSGMSTEPDIDHDDRFDQKKQF
ncbi:hypothetical protein CQW23_26215 [Capsicum baccatum]|uniref:Uncharacterized protein n=1 Tax=Capsicum baccatum TaxID=33114 RepID=A0A2G2VN52_CAPBA|nr:hypothetical protein CQW23_26215 [Capsicum baccatum]